MNRLAVFLLAMLMAAPALAELFRWTDAQGRVHYSDQPPPPEIKQMKRIAAPAASSGGPNAGSHPPVVLFSTNCGSTCDQATDYLRQHNVPFTLKDPSTDPKVAAELKQRTGSLGVPVLFVGESMQRGYAPSVWDKMLEMSGYPALDRPALPAAAPAE